MYTCPFYKLSPNGNVTLLIPQQAIPASQYAAAARVLIAPDHLQAEQVGYINIDAARLDMAGGEFCVNATRAFGALLAHIRGVDELHTTISVSGMQEKVHVHVLGHCPHWQVTATLHFATLPLYETLADGLCLVRVPGINHLLIDEERYPFPQDWVNASAILRKRWNLEDVGAAGCIWWQKHPQGLRMSPVVWVAEPGSTVLENACGSGALACICGLPHLQKRAEQTKVAIMQPSGTVLFLHLQKNPHSWSVDIGGDVSLIAEGNAYWEV